MQHQLLNFLAYNLVNLQHCSTRVLLILFVVWHQRDRVAKANQHVGTSMEIVGVVVARRQYLYIALELEFLGCIESNLQVCNLECSEPTLILVACLRKEHYALAIAQCLTCGIESGSILCHRRVTIVCHTICRKKSQFAQEATCDRVLEYICTSNEIYSSICQVHRNRERVIQTVLVIRHNHKRSAIYGHFLNTYKVFFAEIKSRIYKL